MVLEREITYFSHKKDLIACFPEGKPRAFPCIRRSAWYGKPQAYRLPSRVLWYNCAVCDGTTVPYAMINLYHPLFTSRHVRYSPTMPIAYATVVARRMPQP